MLKKNNVYLDIIQLHACLLHALSIIYSACLFWLSPGITLLRKIMIHQLQPNKFEIIWEVVKKLFIRGHRVFWWQLLTIEYHYNAV